MIDPEQWMNIKQLHKQGLSRRQIARLTGHARNTIAKALAQPAPQPFQKPERPSCLDPFKPYLKERYEAYALSGVRLREEIEAQGFTGSVDIVQRYLKTLKARQSANSRATVRFETPPGQQAQVDWAHVGLVSGQKVYAFVFVLGFSRMLFVTFTASMALPELIRCHQEAFAYFGGVPASILYDNMAQVRKPGSGELHPLMADFAAHCGFAVKTHRPYRPRTKGKVERSVDFVKDNFLNGRSFADRADLIAQGQHWLEKANQRARSRHYRPEARRSVYEGKPCPCVRSASLRAGGTAREACGYRRLCSSGRQPLLGAARLYRWESRCRAERRADHHPARRCYCGGTSARAQAGQLPGEKGTRRCALAADRGAAASYQQVSLPFPDQCRRC